MLAICVCVLQSTVSLMSVFLSEDTDDEDAAPGDNDDDGKYHIGGSKLRLLPH
jgi:hypothetical protein